MIPRQNIIPLANPEAVAHHAAAWRLDRVAGTTGRFGICLAGGSPPRALYERLATPLARGRFPWDRAHWFWGDERFVAPDYPKSNYGMTRRALLQWVPIPDANIHPVATEAATAEDAAAAYTLRLKSFYGALTLDPDRPLFEVTLLSFGTDGHTAPLFPNAPTLQVRDPWTAVADNRGEPRITLTYPTLESSRHIAFLVVGSEKQPMLRCLLNGYPALPAARVRPTGTLWVIADSVTLGAP